MMKLAGGPPLRGALDLSKSFAENLRQAAEVMERPLAELRCAVDDRKRNFPYLETLRERRCRVHRFDHGDIPAALRAALPDYDLDLLAGIGNTPEGLLAAAALQGLGGAMQARLSPMGQVQEKMVLDRSDLRYRRAGRSKRHKRTKQHRGTLCCIRVHGRNRWRTRARRGPRSGEPGITD